MTRSPLRLLLLALILLAGVPARAANPVSPDPRPPRLAAYNDAARRLSVPGWVPAEQNGSVIHAFLRLAPDRLVFTVALPPDTPRAKAEAWFGVWTDSFSLTGADLFSSPQPGGLFLRAEDRRTGTSKGILRQLGGWDLGALRTAIGQMAPGPVLLAIRVQGVEVESVQPAPLVRGASGDDEFLFYRLDASTPMPNPLVVSYGVPRRWVAAGVSALALWFVFPFAALFAVREQLRKRSREDAKDRLRRYRQWQRGITITTIAGVYATMFLLGITRLIALVGPFIFPMVFLVPMAAMTASARLIGLPLEREAWPHRKDLPWYRAAAGELFGAVMMLVLPGGIFLAQAMSNGGQGPRVGPWIFVPLMGLPLVITAGFALYSWMQWQRRKKGPTGSEPEAPEPVRDAVAELTTRLDCPVSRVLVNRGSGMGGAVTSILVQDQVAVVSGDLLEGLEPDQLAGLVAAQALATPRTLPEKALRWGFVLLSFTPMLVMIPVFMGIGSRNPAAARASTPLVFVIMPVIMIASMAMRRSTQRKQEAADLRVAEALGEPRRFVDAVRRLQDMQAAALAVEAGSANRQYLHTERLARLQRKLGID